MENPPFYISRHIRVGESILTEEELLASSDLIILLAPPGAGKTELLKRLAELLQVSSLRAAVFRNRPEASLANDLIIDAMDEVARVSEENVWDIFGKASKATGTVIFASRSSEWESSRTKLIEEQFGREAVTASIVEFTQDEQKLLFERAFQGENFEAFLKETQRFDLTPLLGNPQFLQIFGYAFVQSHGKFQSKLQIYSDAARQLALEANSGRSSRGRPEASAIVKEAGNIFAHLLLSGASGVTVKETIDDHNYPYIGKFKDVLSIEWTALLDSQLFKLGNTQDEHEPVHRIVAEFLAAKHLVNQTEDSSNRLSVRRCLAVIAPNGVVRDELRGLFGWMAALGNIETQKTLIEIDPYAVLANGDPSQLTPQSKTFLIQQLQCLSEQDPYFRRSDMWRSFNIGQFFTNDTVSALRSLIADETVNSHLKILILELLAGTPVVSDLTDELEHLALCRSSHKQERIEAYDLLLDCGEYDATHTLDELISEDTGTSLQMATRLITSCGAEQFTFDVLLVVLRKISALYSRNRPYRRTERYNLYYFTKFLAEFPVEHIEDYIDHLTEDLECTCGKERDFECECRFGRSKTIGCLLDRYFSENKGPYDPERLWAWLKKLRFPNRLTPEDSISVKVLSSNHSLRQDIHKLAFGEAHTAEQYRDVRFGLLIDHHHSGIQIQKRDLIELLKFAEDNSLYELWKCLWAPHSYYSDDKKSNPVRAFTRKQARKNKELQKIWTQLNRHSINEWREIKRTHPTRKNHLQRIDRENKEKIENDVKKNLDAIRGGKHFWWLQHFSNWEIFGSSEISDFVSREISQEALINCIPHLSNHVPSLEEMGQHRGHAIAQILFVACLLRWRNGFPVKDLPKSILLAARVKSGNSSGLDETEVDAFETELNQAIFSDNDDKEQFARAFIEPGLKRTEGPNFASWLGSRPFLKTVRKKLSMEWLERFPDMPFDAEYELFKTACKENSQQDICSLISQRLEFYSPKEKREISSSDHDRRTFWLLNSFFHDDNKVAWEELKSDRNNLLGIAARSERYLADDEELSPPLSPEKLYDVLDAFFEQWPEVELPSSWGSSSPPGEKAYRYISGIPSRIGRTPPANAIPILDRLIAEERFLKFRNAFLSERAFCLRKLALENFSPPSPSDIMALLRNQEIASVEDLRALIIENLGDLEQQIREAETDTLENFYEGYEHVNENTARNRLVELLKGRMSALNLAIEIERHMRDSNRCDITIASLIDGRRRLLMIEVKGQWHRELFSAASTQLDQRYSVHPDAEQQGVYLVLWFGKDVAIADRKRSEIQSSEQLHSEIIKSMPQELKGRIDVFVMDLSR
ncbi:hypothetical protein M9H61_02010 [Thalassospira sp. GO-4]|uniref:hypothetical protein n=1 Tax=Thalassospira sp. GO-4 TaxID=2946605 RepID=UPI0020256FEE|nr:hypothetical protein [Thalassospira sp. GO-4]URK18308.1 hypothetical protein M9H61_02010 [Thalassospira sp. GO-4]